MFMQAMLVLGTTVSLGAGQVPAPLTTSSSVGRPDVGRPPAMTSPAFSPFLNLNRGGLPGVNYFGLVVPQIENQQTLAQIQAQQFQLGAFQQSVQQQLNPLTTGHGAIFFNTSHYYPVRYPVVGNPMRR